MKSKLVILLLFIFGCSSNNVVNNNENKDPIQKIKEELEGDWFAEEIDNSNWYPDYYNLCNIQFLDDSSLVLTGFRLRDRGFDDGPPDRVKDTTITDTFKGAIEIYQFTDTSNQKLAGYCGFFSKYKYYANPDSVYSHRINIIKKITEYNSKYFISISTKRYDKIYNSRCIAPIFSKVLK